MGDALDFSTPARPPPRRWNLLALALVAVALVVAFTRPWWTPAVPPGVMIEVTGDVPRPGHHLVDPPTVRAALAAAGVADPDAVPDGPLVEGERVDLHEGELRVLPATDPALVGLPIDVNTADARALAAIPGVSRARAEAIVAERDAGGPYHDLADLRRADGVGASLLETLRPFVTVSPTPPVDLSTADEAHLERLPGIGPTLAARIVADRAMHGPCRSTADLLRVRGIGEELLAKLDGRAECRAR